jgi:hypothetical protein
LVSQEYRRHLFVGLTNNALVNERHIKEKETECGLSLAVYSCAHEAHLNFEDLSLDLWLQRKVAEPSCGNIGYYINSLGWEVGEGDVVVANSPQARQDLRERRDNEVLGMPAKKLKKKLN